MSKRTSKRTHQYLRSSCTRASPGGMGARVAQYNHITQCIATVHAPKTPFTLQRYCGDPTMKRYNCGVGEVGNWGPLVSASKAGSLGAAVRPPLVLISQYISVRISACTNACNVCTDLGLTYQLQVVDTSCIMQKFHGRLYVVRVFV